MTQNYKILFINALQNQTFLSDEVIKKTTGDTASNHIRQFVIQLAKNGLAAGETVSQVSDRLGFEYPQHFSRMFKKQEGVTPSEYCQRMRT